MLGRILLLLFLLIPILEIAVFLQMGELIGALPTLVGIVLTALIGVHFIKKQGLSTVLHLQQKVEEGQLPAEEIFTGFCLALAGLLLITPGFITDVLGFVLLVPPFRHAMIKHLFSKLMTSGVTVYSVNQTRYSGRTYDGEYESVNKNNRIE